MTLPSKNFSCLVLEKVRGEAVHGDDDDEGKEEGEERANDDKVSVVDLTDPSRRHHIVYIHQC